MQFSDCEVDSFCKVAPNLPPLAGVAAEGLLNQRPLIKTEKLVKCQYHDGLLHQCVAVLAHVLQDLVGGVVPGRGGGLGGHSQRVDQSLRASNSTAVISGTVVGEKITNPPSPSVRRANGLTCGW